MEAPHCVSSFTLRSQNDFRCIYKVQGSSSENILEIANCLQNTFLVWIPCLFSFLAFLLHVLLRFVYPRRGRSRCTALRASKIVIAFLVCVLLVIRCVIDSHFTKDSRLSIPSVLLVFTGVTLLWMILYDHRHGVLTSGLIFVGWLVLVLSSSVQFLLIVFNAASKHGSCTTADDVCFILYFILAIIEVVLQTWADKRKILPHATTKYGPTENVSFFNRILFGFFWKLTFTGWKRPLKFDDLWCLSTLNQTDHVHENWMGVWSKGVERFNPETKTYYHPRKRPHESIKLRKYRSILSTSLICYKWLLIPAVLLNAVGVLLQFVGPQVLKYLLGFMQDNTKPVILGIGATLFMFMCDTLQTICQQQHMYHMFLISFRLRSALMSAIYAKILRLSSTDNKDNSGKIVTYVTSDVQRILNVVSRFQMVWTSPVQLILALYYLYQMLGSAAFVGFAATLIFIPVNIYLTRLEQKFQATLMNRKDIRVGALSEIINCIKVIKLNAWELVFSRRIEAKRRDELLIYRKINILQAGQDLTVCLAPLAVSALSFAAFILLDPVHNLLTPQVAFVSLSLFNILRQPLNDFPALVSGLLQANISRKRLENFLACAEINQEAVQRTSSDLSDGDVRFINGCFQHNSRPNPDFSLKNINLSLKAGQLIAIIGPVGSGKTSLLSAILGEIVRTDGTVTVMGEVAYVSQEAWITNATVRDNILFNKPYDPSDYNNVIRACALLSDFQTLPDGDNTEIGEKGSNLSGGQKQRISLARAVYQDRDIYLLDDPLAAVDVHVGKHIFTNVISSDGGLLQRKTRIFVTHNVRYLKYADHVVVMKDGCVAMSGSYDEICRDKIFSYLLEIDETKEEDKSLSEQSIETTKQSDVKTETSVAFHKSSSSSSIASVKIQLEGVDVNDIETNVDKLTSAIDSEKTKFLPAGAAEEKVETGRVHWNVYRNFLKALGYPSCFTVILCFIVSLSFNLSSNFWLAKWTDDVAMNRTSIDMRQRLTVYAFLGIFESAFVFTAALFCAHAMKRASTLLHSKMLRSVLRSPMRFFDTTPVGVIMTRFSSDCDQLDWLLPFCLQQWAYGMFKIVCALIIVVVGSPLFAIAILPLAIFFYVIQRFFICTARQVKRLSSANNSPVVTMFSTTYQGVSCIRAYGAQKFFITDCHNRIDRSQIAWFPSIVSNRWLALNLQFFGNGIVLLAALFAVMMRGESTESGLLGLAITSTLTITYSLIAAVRSMSEVETSIVAAERVQEYTELKSEADWETDYKVAKDWPNLGRITFDDYSTKHRTDLDLALRQISCVIDAGKKVGVVGRTGAGKSTLSLALLRAIEPTGGRILIDDVDISLLGLHLLRSRIAIIPQEPVLFNGSIRFNLDPLGQHADDQLYGVLDQANQRSFISSLSEKLDFVVEQSGSNLSVGQRQLLCLARALLKNSKIMILDEATAAVDVDTEEVIQKAMAVTAENKTVIAIAHRLTTVLDADMVMVMSEGKLIEFDSPKRLISDQSSTFASMIQESGL